MYYNLVSYFRNPITNKQPASVITLQGLHRFITCDTRLEQATQQVRNALPDERAFRRAKQQLLPYFTPGGVFTYCSREGLLWPSGLFPLDFDHLPSPQMAQKLRDDLFADPMLQAALTFVSPSSTGVKAMVPFRLHNDLTVEEAMSRAMENAWNYVELTYRLKADRANRDIARACFLCHDKGAKVRTTF